MFKTAQRMATLEQLSVFILGALLTLTLAAATTAAEPKNGKTYSRSEQFYQIPDVRLTTMDGHQVSLAGLLNSEDKPVLLNFIFTSCPGICPVMSATFSRFQQILGTQALAQIRMI
jgi:cytochrome oxidase Cu insertion factor (SCO1/SenC/PrrC family)